MSFWVIFWGKTHFQAKNHFSAERKNARFSVIPARTGSVVLLGHFLMARTVPPSFVEIGPKLRVVAPLSCHQPKTAKNRGEPQKMTPSSETEFFLGVVPMGKLQPRVQWSFVPSTKIAITKQKIDFWPQISKFWGQKSTFLPLAANWSLTDQCFQHEKGVSLESRYEGTKIFTPCPQKIGFWAQKRPNLAKNWHFGPNIGIFGPFDLRPDQKTMRTNCLGGFCYVGTKTFTYSHKNQDFWPKNGQIWSKICIFGHFGPNIAIFCTFCPMPNQKPM